jgi:hypothetical protein
MRPRQRHGGGDLARAGVFHAGAEGVLHLRVCDLRQTGG